MEGLQVGKDLRATSQVDLGASSPVDSGEAFGLTPECSSDRVARAPQATRQKFTTIIIMGAELLTPPRLEAPMLLPGLMAALMLLPAPMGNPTAADSPTQPPLEDNITWTPRNPC